MKIVLASMAPFVGGAEVAMERLALGLVDEGHEIAIVLGQTGAVQEKFEGVGLRCLISPMFYTDKLHYLRYWLARRRLRKLFKVLRPDIIHSNDLNTHQIISDAARNLGVPRICHHRFPFDGRALAWLNKFKAERHLFVSQALLDEMCGQTNGIRRHLCTALYDGLPIPEMPGPEDRLAIRQQLGLPTDRVVVTIMGQVIERKGVADLIEAWALLDPVVQARAMLLICGDDLAGNGAYRVQMEQLASRLGVPARFIGFQKDVKRWLVASDISVVPSHVEPLGNATLEAMSHGLPVIGARAGGIPESVLHEETGLLVAPKNPAELAQAVARLVSDADLRLRLGRQGRARCEEKFSLPVHARAVLAEYQIARRSLGRAQNGKTPSQESSEAAKVAS